MTDTCPVCGKGDSELFDGGWLEDDGSKAVCSRAVSHLDCVRQMEQRAKDSEYNFGVEHDALEQAEANITKASSDWKLEQQRRLEAESENARLKAQNIALRGKLDSEQKNAIKVWDEQGEENARLKAQVEKRCHTCRHEVGPYQHEECVGAVSLCNRCERREK